MATRGGRDGARDRDTGRVALVRALSKLGIASRAMAGRLIAAGRVRVDGRVVRDPLIPVVPERVRVEIDGESVRASRAATVLLHKPRGVVTTSSDPKGRPTVFDLVSVPGCRLVAVGRLDLATTGLILLTTDTRLAAWLTDPVNDVPRVYLARVRGEVSDEACRRMEAGVDVDGEALRAESIVVRKRSGRETHLVVTLREGRNREIRRLFAAAGHEVTRLKRAAFGGLTLGALEPGTWRELGDAELREAFPGAPVRSPTRRGAVPAAPRPA
jgi:23S rRNA pseudouridine2605 synthase